jgi:hypothetical protein
LDCPIYIQPTERSNNIIPISQRIH